MAEDSYYEYALKDPRISPVMPFYIGKGVGTRAYDLLVRSSESDLPDVKISVLKRFGKPGNNTGWIFLERSK